MFETEFQMRLRDLNTANHVDNLEIMRVADEARALFLGGVEGERGAGFGVLASMPSTVVVLAAAQHAEFRAEIHWQPGATRAQIAWWRRYDCASGQGLRTRAQRLAGGAGMSAPVGRVCHLSRVRGARRP